MKCKCEGCNFEAKNNMSLSRHLKYSHNMSLLDYKIKYEGFEIPKCICGNNVKYKDGMRFSSTCGDAKCVTETLREKRLKFMKENPEQTAWRMSKSNLSYPEKRFTECLTRHGVDKKYLIVREKSVFPYFIDFAFVNEKVAVEIDGSQHKLKDRKEKDEKKDQLLIEKGWRVYRVTAKQVLQKVDDVMGSVLGFIGDSKSSGICGIEEYKSKTEEGQERRDKERDENGGLTNEEISRSKKQRKVNRPPYEQLKKEIKEFGYRGTGKLYGVSDNGIRRWVKTYEKHGF